MPSDIVFDPTTQALARALTLHQKRHDVLASNLANVETPGFRAREVEFKDALEAAFREAAPGAPPAAPTARMRVVDDKTAPARADGNTVDVDTQMLKLTANSGQYGTLARLIHLRLNMLRFAIEGTR